MQPDLRPCPPPRPGIPAAPDQTDRDAMTPTRARRYATQAGHHPAPRRSADPVCTRSVRVITECEVEGSDSHRRIADMGDPGACGRVCRGAASPVVLVHRLSEAN